MKPIAVAAKRERKDVGTPVGSRITRQRQARIANTNVAAKMAKAKGSGRAAAMWPRITAGSCPRKTQ